MQETLQKGFTLIELLVVCAIMVVVSSIILADNNKFGGAVQLQNLAYDIALSVRQAQVYGISVERFGTDTFSAGYGMHFAVADPTDYILFADVYPSTPDGLYEANQGELAADTSIGQGFSISDLCATPSGGSEQCGLSSLDIVYERPEPDAWISASGSSCILDHLVCEASARIVVQSPRGDMMSISVDANGQIAVEQTTTLAP